MKQGHVDAIATAGHANQQLRAVEQRTCELSWSDVLFGQSPAQHADETGVAERTLYRQVANFAQLRMASFVPPPKIATQ